VDRPVQAQVRERYETLIRKIANRHTAPEDLATAYGQYGMILQAAEYFDAAEPCYLNAEALVPDDIRWRYYLAHVYKSKGATDRAEAVFRQVLALRPDDFPTIVWLGRLMLDDGRPVEAQSFFDQALDLMPQSVAALAGLGRADLAQHDYEAAAKHLESALTIDSSAESLHSPLAMAYRGLGQLDKAAPHLRQWKNTDLPLADPLQQELDLLLESGLSYELRGVRELDSRDFGAAAGFFQKGLDLTPENTPLRRSLQHKLGTALFMTGDINAAAQQLEAVVRAAPDDAVDESTAKAHYSLGVIAASRGRQPSAVDHFVAAVRYQPNYVEAWLALADVHRRAGRAAEALGEYDEAIKINPRSVPGRLGYAMSLVALHHEGKARAWLEDSIRAQPDDLPLQHGLARLLATAPDDRVRDGRRAMTLVQQLMKGVRSTDLGETMAMAAAELGNFDEAVTIQRGVLAAAERAGLADPVRRMQDNLRLYERHRPCRRPWTNDEAVVLPSGNIEVARQVASQ
jgi:tetratricopeptide (TPR) repeat protein